MSNSLLIREVGDDGLIYSYLRDRDNYELDSSDRSIICLRCNKRMNSYDHKDEYNNGHKCKESI